MLNRVEAGIRAYDPCLSCSTHAVGEMPLQVELVAADGTCSTPWTRGEPRRKQGGSAVVDCPDSVLVIAWGNPLREDDAVAWHVLEGLREAASRAPALPALHLRHAHQLTPEMAECVSRAAGVVFVDARRDGTPGEVRCEAIDAVRGSNPLAHSLEPARRSCSTRSSSTGARPAGRRPEHRRRALRHGRGSLARGPPAIPGRSAPSSARRGPGPEPPSRRRPPGLRIRTTPATRRNGC